MLFLVIKKGNDKNKIDIFKQKDVPNQMKTII